LGGTESIPVSLSPDNSFYYLLERPVEVTGDELDITIEFDLRKGFTPPSLETADGKRLSSEKVKNIDLILFINGSV